MISDSNDETNFPYKLLLTDTQALRLCKALANASSANTKLSKTQLSETVQLGRFLSCEFLSLLNPKQLAKNIDIGYYSSCCRSSEKN